jgi:hypothetical protein
MVWVVGGAQEALAVAWQERKTEGWGIAAEVGRVVKGIFFDGDGVEGAQDF